MSSREISRASLFLASGTIVSRALGFVRAIVLAGVIGLVGSASADAFAVANQLPNTIYAIVAGGVLSAVLVPHIISASSNPDGGASYINKLLTISLALLAGTTIVATLAAPLLTLAYGTQLNPETLALATSFAWWCLPQIFFYGLYSVLGEVLNARKLFGPFTWAPVVNNLVALLGLGAMAWLFSADPMGMREGSDWTPAMVATLAGTATLGVAAQAFVLLLFWRRIDMRFRLDFRWRGVGLGRAGRTASWTFGMLLLSTFAGLIEVNIVGVASNTEGAASVAALNNAWLIFMLPHSIIAVSIGTAFFTRLSEHAAAGDSVALRSDLRNSLRVVAVAMTLAAAVVAVCSSAMAAVFMPLSDQQDSAAAITAFALIICAFIIGLVPFSALFMVQRAFYALHDTKTPFGYTLVQVAVFIVLAFAATAVPDDWIAATIALAMSIAGTVQLFVALWLLRRKVGPLGLGSVWLALLRSSLAALVAIALGVGVMALLGANPWQAGFALESRWSAILSMGIAGTVMTLGYFATLALVRAPEAAELRQLLRRRAAAE